AAHNGLQLTDRRGNPYSHRSFAARCFIGSGRQLVVHFHFTGDGEVADRRLSVDDIAGALLHDREFFRTDPLAVFNNIEPSLLDLDRSEQKDERQQNVHEFRMTPIISSAADSGVPPSVEM